MDAKASTTQPQSTFIVPAPFDSASRADCILESKTGDQFRVLRAILSLASPVFSDMFDLPQGPSSNSAISALPTITVSEDSETLLALLLQLYPPLPNMPTSSTIDIDVFGNLVEVHEKYDISMGRLYSLARPLYLSKYILSNHAMHLYALAWRLGLEAEAKTASRYTHRVDLSDRAINRDLIRRSGNVDALLALNQLRKKREEAPDEIIRKLGMFDNLCWYHGGYSSDQTFYPQDFWLQFIELKQRARDALQMPYPKCTDILAFFGLTPGKSPCKRIGGNCKEDGCFSKSTTSLSTFASAVKDYPAEIKFFIDVA